MNTKVNPLEDDHYEVVLQVTVTVKSQNQTAFLVEVNQAGAFLIQGYPKDQLNNLLASFCPTNLFPYAREAISNLISKGSFPEMHLSPINFDALYAQRLDQEKLADEGVVPTAKPDSVDIKH